MIGQVVGTYRILAQIGAGGMGSVWLAEHTLLGRRVAIKFLLPDVSQNPTIVDRFFAEAKAATRIADPGIVVVYDFGWHTDGAAFIVMEHLAGESVMARLRNGRLSVVDAVRIVQHAALAMAVAHAAGIVHRDLKPDNLFLVPDPAVTGGERTKILDFGIAKLLGDEHGNLNRTSTGVIMGTPTFMSPEQCRGAGEVDHRTDIYALGCVLFLLLTGRLPFVASTPGDMIAAHLREAAPAPSMFVPQIPATIDAIVARCLAKSADDRYRTMTELARDLGAAIGSVTEIASIAPLRGAPITPPPSVTRDAETVAGSRSVPVYATAPQPSTFTQGAGESMRTTRGRGRMLGVVIAVAALGAIATTIVVATTRSRDHATPITEPVRPAVSPESPVDAAVAAQSVIDAAPVVVDAATAAPPSDAKRRPPRVPKPDPADDPYATP